MFFVIVFLLKTHASVVEKVSEEPLALAVSLDNMKEPIYY